jgi:hypothetical protein
MACQCEFNVLIEYSLLLTALSTRANLIADAVTALSMSVLFTKNMDLTYPDPRRNTNDTATFFFG